PGFFTFNGSCFLRHDRRRRLWVFRGHDQCAPWRRRVPAFRFCAWRRSSGRAGNVPLQRRRRRRRPQLFPLRGKPGVHYVAGFYGVFQHQVREITQLGDGGRRRKLLSPGMNACFLLLETRTFLAGFGRSSAGAQRRRLKPDARFSVPAGEGGGGGRAPRGRSFDPHDTGGRCC
ncbi:unnamed protein product, partial [Ectocarpus sp. 12 AP-2014]